MDFSVQYQRNLGVVRCSRFQQPRKKKAFLMEQLLLSFWVKMVLHVVLPRKNFEIEANEVGWLAVFNVNVN